MNSIPKLEEILINPTVVILGAGASKDYGFPLWDELKEMMLKAFSSGTLLGNSYKSHLGAQYWLDALKLDESLTNSKKRSVDELAYDAHNEGLELFQMFILNEFLKLEAEDRVSNRFGWIEKLADKYIELIKTNQGDSNSLKQLMENFRVISFNYERSFAWRFNNRVNAEISNIFPNRIRSIPLQNIKRNFNRIFHPHGCVGMFPKTQEISDSYISIDSKIHTTKILLTRSYGESDETITDVNHLDSILPVDLIPFGSGSDTYDRANTFMTAETNVILIGMSDIGIRAMSGTNTRQKLNISRANRVYYSGDAKLFNNFIPLNMHAEEIVDYL